MDDDYGDQIENDAALAAALETAERAHATKTASSLPGAPPSAGQAQQAPHKPIVGQPVPQKIGRGGSSSIIVNSRQVCVCVCHHPSLLRCSVGG